MINRIFKNEEMYLKILKSIGDAVIVTTVNGDIFFINQVAEKLSKWSNNEALGKPIELIFNIINEHTRAPVENPSRTILKEGHVGGLAHDTILIGKDGTEIPIDDSVTLLKDNDGKVLGTVLIFRDITERKKAKDALKESEQRLKDAQVLGKIGYWEFDINTQKIIWSDQVFELYNRDLSLGPPTSEEEGTYYSPETTNRLREYASRAIEYGEEFKYDLEATLPGGNLVQLSALMRPIKDKNGRATKLIGTVQNITERKKAEDALKESELMLQKTQEIGQIGSFAMDLSTNDIVWSDQLYKLFGLKKEGKTIDYEKVLALIHPDDKVRAMKVSSKASKERKPYTLEHRVIHPDGKILNLLITGDVIRNKKNEVVKLGGITQDITERKKKEKELQLHSAIMTNISEGVYLTRLEDGIIVYTNPRFEEMFGYNPGEMIGKYVTIVNASTDKSPEETKQHIVGILRETGEWHGEVNNIKKDGTTFWCYANVSLFNHPEYGKVSVSVHTDINEHKKAEQKLHESEEKFRGFLDFGNIGMAITSVDKKWVYCNDQLCQMFGFTREELFERSWTDISYPEDLQSDIEQFNSVLDGEIDSYQIDKRYIKKNGEIIYAHLTVSCIRNSDGTVKHFIATIQDITERVMAEQKLQESEEKFRITAEHSLIGIAIIQNNAIIYANEILAKMFEYSIQEIMEWSGKEIFAAVHPDDRHIAIQRFNAKKMKELEDSPSYPYRIITKSGKIKWIINYSSVILYLGKEAILASIVDITETKMVEQKLKESEEEHKNLSLELEIILDNIPALIFYKDLDNNFIQVNKYVADAHNVPKDFLKGKSLFELYPKEEAQAYWDDDLEVIKSGKPKLNIEEPWETPKGKRWVNTSKIPIFDSKKNIKGVLGMSSDITEKKLAEDNLKQSETNYRRAFNRAEFYKDLFAHDINNILQSVLTAADINLMKLRKLEVSKDLLEVNHSIKEQVNRGAKLVSNIRKLSLIEEQEIKLQPINFIKILEKSINFIKKSYKHQQIEIQISQEEDLPNINANDFLEDVFENILLNAVKYSQNLKKEILVKISKEKKAELNYVKIEFIDNGIGIPDLTKEKIFHRTYNEGRSVGGLGLGLSLVKKIVETYNGHIWVENKIKDDHSKGSNFVLLLHEVEF